MPRIWSTCASSSRRRPQATGDTGAAVVGYSDIVVKLAAIALAEAPDPELAVGRRSNRHLPRSTSVSRSIPKPDLVPVIRDVPGLTPPPAGRAIAGPDRPSPTASTEGRGNAGRHVHRHQSGPVRNRRIHADHQCSRVRDAGDGTDPSPAGRRRRISSSARDRMTLEPDLRPSDRRRSARGAVPPGAGRL